MEEQKESWDKYKKGRKFTTVTGQLGNTLYRLSLPNAGQLDEHAGTSIFFLLVVLKFNIMSHQPQNTSLAAKTFECSFQAGIQLIFSL